MSMNLSLVLVIIFNEIINLTNSNNITCVNNGLCEGKPIICNNNEDCYIKCTEINACRFADVQCPISGKCNLYCGIDRNTCDDIIINATYSKSLYIYCADNECDDAIIHCPHNNKYDHQCILSGTKPIDRITFYTQQGFNDINIENIQLTESVIFCGLTDEQYTCNINTQENGCETSDDKTCETYRLPTMYPTSNMPSISPTNIPTINPTQSTYKPSNSPIQIYNNENKRLEFYIYYNDSNGINMIFGKWMQYELLNTYEQFRITSTNTEWNNAGLMNFTFCSVYNVNYNNNNENKWCQRFKEYGYYDDKNRNDENINTNRNLNIPGQFNAEFVAYGTFGIYADESINSYQLFLIDIFTSYLFQKTFNLNMNNRINTVGFDDTFEAIEIIVQPFNPIKQNAINNTQNINSDYNINIILGVLIGILFALTVIIFIYGIRFYFITKKKKKNKKKNKYRNSKHNREGIEGKKDKQNIEVAINDDIIIPQRKQFQPIPSVAPSSMTTQALDILNNNNNDPYLEDDKLMAPGYYLNKLQQGYLSTDNESNENSYENDSKLQIISSIDDNPSSDSNDNKSVISSIISFRKRKKKHKNMKQQTQKHERAKTVEINNPKRKKSHGPKRKRSFHWGFTDDGGENNNLHLKSQSVFTFNNNSNIELQSHCGNSLKQLELARNSSFHSHHTGVNNNINPQSQLSSSFNSNISTNKSNISHHFNIDEIEHDNTINDAQFLAALSPSIKSVEDMYALPKSPDGNQICTGHILANNNKLTDDIVFKKPLSPIKNQIDMDTCTLSNIIDEHNKDIHCNEDNEV